MRTVKPRVLLLVALAAGILASAALAAGLGPGSSSATKPRLSITSTAPLVVVGRDFGSKERITLVATVGGARTAKALTAGNTGRFVARFRTANACAPAYVVANGANGRRAAARKQVVPGPCGIDMAPGAELDR